MPISWEAGGAQPIDIQAPDRYSSAVLLDFAGAAYAPELVPGDGWVVRLQPPSTTGWVLEVLALVERWLEYVRQPSVELVCGAKSYVIRTSTDGASPAAAARAPEPAEIGG